MSERVSIALTPLDDGWLARVRTGGGTAHEVTVRRDYLDSMAASAAPEDVVRASFEFLLEREPASAILRRFDLSIIGRYFPEYEAEMRKRFGGG